MSAKRFLVLTAVCFVAAFIGSYAAQVKPSGADPSCGPGCGLAAVVAGSSGNLTSVTSGNVATVDVVGQPSFSAVFVPLGGRGYSQASLCSVTTSSGAATITGPICTVTPGASGTTFTLTYNAGSYANAPACFVQSTSTAGGVGSCSTSVTSGNVTATVTFASATTAAFYVALVGNGG
jgi:hypothetical protein